MAAALAASAVALAISSCSTQTQERIVGPTSDTPTVAKQSPSALERQITELVRQNKFLQARKLANELVAIHPTQQSFEMRARLLLMLELPAATLDDCRMLKKLRNEGPGWEYVHRHRLWKDQGDFDEAADDLTRAIALSPSTTALAAVNSELYAQRSQLYLSLSEKNKALQDAIKSVQLQPNDAQHHVVLGQTLGANGRTSEAMAQANEAQRLDPRNVAALGLRAVLLLELGSPESALKDIEEQLKLDDSPHHFLYKLRAECYKRLGKLDLANKDLTTAEQVETDERNKKDNYQVLRRSQSEPQVAK